MRTRRLIVTTLEGERELLFIGRLTVGRAPECDISVADTKISRRHAEFDASGHGPRVSDLGSRNGILVNGRKVGAADLAPGDVVTVGDARIRFEEGAVEVPDPGLSMSATDDRTAVLAPLTLPAAGAISASPAGPPPSDDSPYQPPSQFEAPVPDPPPVSPPTPPQVAAPMVAAAPLYASAATSADPEKTSILTRAPAMPAAPVAAPRVADPSGERTSVLPPPERRPAAAVPSAPLQTAPVVTTARVDAHPAPLAPPQMVAPAPTPPASVATASGNTLQAPKFSWGGVVTAAAVLLGGLAVLLGALPLLSSSASALDALSQRQARTLAGWLAAGVDPRAPTIVDSRVLESILAQPGVERAMVLERASGRAVAPATLGGRVFGELPGIGAEWRTLTAPRVGRTDSYADAYVPAGDAAFVAWVRYERPATQDTGLAIVVALVASLVLAMLVAMLIKRQTRAVLQHFTRQVELVVSGASPKVMQGGLVPGLERLPGVVIYLLERRTGGPMSPGEAGAGLLDLHVGGSDPGGVVDLGPPWLTVTPSLMVADSSAHGPTDGAPGWASARGRHLLDVLTDGPVRNSVVQGLGALGMQAGAETSVALPDAAMIGLRREASGHVRVTLGAR